MMYTKEEEDEIIWGDAPTIYNGRKGFSHRLHNENDSSAKVEGAKLLAQSGWKPTTRKELYKKGDTVFEKPLREGLSVVKTFEFERRGEELNWTQDRFPYSTVHIPGRKNEEDYIYDFYIAFNTDLNRAALISRETVKNSPVVFINTKNKKSNEQTVNEDMADVDCNKARMFKKIDDVWVASAVLCGRTWVAPT